MNGDGKPDLATANDEARTASVLLNRATEASRPSATTEPVRAAGLEHRSPYALRHTFATLAIAAGVSLYELARFLGTSVDQIDCTYGHLLPDSIDRARAALDAFVSGACPAEKAENAR